MDRCGIPLPSALPTSLFTSPSVDSEEGKLVLQPLEPLCMCGAGRREALSSKKRNVKSQEGRGKAGAKWDAATDDGV